MNKSKLQKYQRLLEELRDRLRTEMNDMVAKSAEHLRTEGDVPADRDAEGYGEELTLIRNERQLLSQAIAALERIKQGVFGACQQCDKRIDEARLDSVPYTALCVDCAKEVAGET